MDRARAAVASALRLHPRVAQQHIVDTAEQRKRLAAALPRLVPFGGNAHHAVVALLDWDHHLPSRQLVLRVLAFYDAEALDRFEDAVAERLVAIKQRDLFPEFDVPDFEELPADECYDAELTLELAVTSMRLVSPWRRHVEAATGQAAVKAVRASPAFAKVHAAEPGRPTHLGDLEPVAWMPPCETALPRWTVDVWWLTAFDGRNGRGWSFLVDTLAAQPVLSHREFTVRSN